jgi:hypothetical protein
MVCVIDGGPALSAAAAKLFLKDITKYSLSPGDRPCIATFVPSKKVCLRLQVHRSSECFFLRDNKKSACWLYNCETLRSGCFKSTVAFFRLGRAFVHKLLSVLVIFVVALDPSSLASLNGDYFYRIFQNNISWLTAGMASELSPDLGLFLFAPRAPRPLCASTSTRTSRRRSRASRFSRRIPWI